MHALAIPVALAIRPATPTAAPSTTSRSARPSSARCTGRPQGTLLATGDRGPECSAGRGSSWPPGRIASNSPTPDFVASPAGPAPALIGGTECPRPPADPSPRRRTSRPCATTPRAPVPRGSRKELRTPADDRLSPYLAGPAADIRVDRPCASCSPPPCSGGPCPSCPRSSRSRRPARSYAGRSAAPARRRRAGHCTGLPDAGHPRRDVADLLIPDPAEIRSRPASTTQETIVNTDIHRCRSGLDVHDRPFDAELGAERGHLCHLVAHLPETLATARSIAGGVCRHPAPNGRAGQVAPARRRTAVSWPVVPSTMRME